jgi:hypothetical protein
VVAALARLPAHGPRLVRPDRPGLLRSLRRDPFIRARTAEPILGCVTISRRVAWFLLSFGVWSWVIWPTFLRNIWKDKRSWNDGMTSFFAVHLALTVVSLGLGTAIGLLGLRALRALKS